MPDPADPRTLRAVLVGIDDYPPPDQLSGCVNDIERVSHWLGKRAVAAGDRFEPLLLRNGQATRKAVIDGFRTHLAVATERDVALFYFCGHGSQELARPEHLAAEPDGLNETLVLVDSRLDGGRDLIDKDLAVLVAEVAAVAGHVLVVLDCCHAGSGVRDPNVRVRRVPPRQNPPAAALTMTRAAAGRGASAGRLPPGGRYVLLAACRPDQQAQEVPFGRVPRGVFSVALEQALAGIGGAPAYEDVQRWVAAAVRNLAVDQSPVLEAPVPADIRLPFLGGVAAPAVPIRTASFARGCGWVLDAGRLQGIAPAQPSDATRLSLHWMGSETGGPVVTTGTVTDVRATTSDLTLDDPTRVDQEATYLAVVTHGGRPQATVAVSGSTPLAERLRERVRSSATIRLTAEDGADLNIDCTDREVLLRRPHTNLPPAAVLPAAATDAIDQTVAAVEHIGRWLDMSRRTNLSSQLPPDGVQLSVVDATGEPVPLVNGVAEVRYTGADHPVIGISYRNNSDVPLHCAVLGLSELYGIECLTIGGSVLLRSAEVAWVTDSGGRPHIQTCVPDDRDRTTDRLLLLASTDPFEAQTMQQPDLIPAGTTRAVSATRTFDRGAVPALSGSDWTTRSLLVTTVRAGRSAKPAVPV